MALFPKDVDSILKSKPFLVLKIESTSFRKSAIGVDVFYTSFRKSVIVGHIHLQAIYAYMNS